MAVKHGRTQTEDVSEQDYKENLNQKRGNDWTFEETV
jgi:hypothetical protein